MYIEIKNARKTYGNGETAVNALDNISINLDQGKIYVVLGPSGSGKSTFLNMLGGLDHIVNEEKAWVGFDLCLS